MSDKLEIGFELDRRWHWLRGEMEATKKPALLALARVLDIARTPYAIIGGIAVQIRRLEPRTALDIELAVTDLAVVPKDLLARAGFRETGRFAHSVNWLGPDATPVQFTDDPALGGAIERAESIDLGGDLDGVPLRVILPVDLLHEKLRAAADHSRRRSKRLQDLADAEGLLEERPDLGDALSEEERALLERHR